MFQAKKRTAISKAFEKSSYRLFCRLKTKIGKFWKKSRVQAKELLFSFAGPSLAFGLSCLVFSLIVIKPLARETDNCGQEPRAFLLTKIETAKADSSEELFLSAQKCLPKETADLSIIESNSVLASSPPLTVKNQSFGALTSEELEEIREDIIEYTVQYGDNLEGIAEKFNISLNTLLWANNLAKNSKIKTGSGLIILPVSGVLYYVESKDTVEKIGKLFKADSQKIIDFNHLDENGKIAKGDILVVPDGTMPPKTVIKPPSLASLPSSYFLFPVPSSFIRTQGLHWYNAVDLSNGRCGDPIYASAQGQVEKIGFNQTSGNFVRINHPNQTTTYYGHLLSILVAPGQSVSRGQVIGYIGSTGYTKGATGCHLHFAVYGAKNPFAY